MADTPTREIWDKYQEAFDYFNGQLFDGKLSSCILNLDAKGRSMGHFTPKRWHKGDITSHEISLNPELLMKQKASLTMEMLVRQMLSLWQYEFGSPPSHPGYCNYEWAERMKEIGLIPSDTGLPGGQETGFRVRHYVDPEGRFAQALAAMPEDYFPWKAKSPHRTKAQPTRIKYVCPVCSSGLWASRGLKAKCFQLDCNAFFEEVTE